MSKRRHDEIISEEEYSSDESENYDESEKTGINVTNQTQCMQDKSSSHQRCKLYIIVFYLYTYNCIQFYKNNFYYLKVKKKPKAKNIKKVVIQSKTLTKIVGGKKMFRYQIIRNLLQYLRNKKLVVLLYIWIYSLLILNAHEHVYQRI